MNQSTRKPKAYEAMRPTKTERDVASLNHKNDPARRG